IKTTDIHLQTFCTYCCHCYALFVAENYVFLIAKNAALLITAYIKRPFQSIANLQEFDFSRIAAPTIRVDSCLPIVENRM
ncbi:hypothetical protein ACFQRK_12190, partial [Parapedobacter sp. GCM10030251]|uniref:hypothetical protein n=1 Tax=Parapedobacter sp. GCM10030251 TaxID=3273419 RepID=UPI003611A8A2